MEHDLLLWSWAPGKKTFFTLNSAEHEILNAHKYKRIKKFSVFQAQISIERYFPTVDIFTFMSRENVMVSLVEHEKSL